MIAQLISNRTMKTQTESTDESYAAILLQNTMIC